MPNLETHHTNKKKSIGTHLVANSVILGLPFVFGYSQDLTLGTIGLFLIPTVLILILFYANYNLLIEKLLFHKRYAAYILSNIGIILGCSLMLSSDVYLDIKRERMQQEHLRVIKELEESDKTEHKELRQRLRDNKEQFRDKKRGRRQFRHSSPRFLSGFFLFGCISILASIGIKSNQRASNESDKRKHLENEYLKSQNAFLSYQIQPHFFFNTLNSIHALIDISKEEAKQTLIDLSRLMRYVLNVSEQDEVPLNQEIEFLKNYSDLMRLRISDNFDFKFDIALLTKNQTIAPLLLIVLVENAFKHGVSGLDTDFIHISCSQKENKFVFMVKNSRYENEVHTSKDLSIGIENLRTRLQLMYPNSHEFSTVSEHLHYTSTLTITL